MPPNFHLMAGASGMLIGAYWSGGFPLMLMAAGGLLVFATAVVEILKEKKQDAPLPPETQDRIGN